MLALHVALRMKRRLAGVIAYSGVMIAAEALQEELTSKPPVLLVHGEQDSVVPAQASQVAHRFLTHSGLDAKLLLRPNLAHGIDEEGLRLEPALLYRSGVRDEVLVQRILSAVRTPGERLGDLDAQLAANAVGARSLRRMVAGRGRDTVLRYGRALLDYSAAFMRPSPPSVPTPTTALDFAGATPSTSAPACACHRAAPRSSTQRTPPRLAPMRRSPSSTRPSS